MQGLKRILYNIYILVKVRGKAIERRGEGKRKEGRENERKEEKRI